MTVLRQVNKPPLSRFILVKIFQPVAPKQHRLLKGAIHLERTIHIKQGIIVHVYGYARIDCKS